MYRKNRRYVCMYKYVRHGRFACLHACLPSLTIYREAEPAPTIYLLLPLHLSLPSSSMATSSSSSDPLLSNAFQRLFLHFPSSSFSLSLVSKELYIVYSVVVHTSKYIHQNGTGGGAFGRILTIPSSSS